MFVSSSDGLGRQYGMPEIKPISAMCKTSALPILISLQPLLLTCYPGSHVWRPFTPLAWAGLNAHIHSLSIEDQIQCGRHNWFYLPAFSSMVLGIPSTNTILRAIAVSQWHLPYEWKSPFCEFHEYVIFFGIWASVHIPYICVHICLPLNPRLHSVQPVSTAQAFVSSSQQKLFVPVVLHH